LDSDEHHPAPLWRSSANLAPDINVMTYLLNDDDDRAITNLPMTGMCQSVPLSQPASYRHWELQR